jgi:hypothetical protein
LGTYLFVPPDFNRAWKFKGVTLDIKKQEGKKSNLGVMNKNWKTEKKLKNWNWDTGSHKIQWIWMVSTAKKVSSVQVDYTWKRSFQGPPSLPSFLLTPGSFSKTVVVSFRPYWGSLVWNYMCSCSYCGNLLWWPIFLRLELWLAHVLQMILNLGQICTPPTCRSVTSNILLISSHIKQTASTKH